MNLQINPAQINIYKYLKQMSDENITHLAQLQTNYHFVNALCKCIKIYSIIYHMFSQSKLTNG